MMQHITVSFDPSKEHLDIIENWLIKESIKAKHGFYVNWKNSVLISQSRGLMCILLLNNDPIGFMTWYSSDRLAELVIAEIKPRLRKKGYGKFLLEALLDKLKSEGVFVVTLHCQPPTSEPAWKKLGFIQFPNVKAFSDKNSDHGKRLYRILIPCASLIAPGEATEIMQLWTSDPQESPDEQPKWTWSLNFSDDQGNLKLPVIFPAKRSWLLRWSRGRNLIKEDGIEYFEGDGLNFSDFLIIDHLNLPQTRI